MRHRNYGYLLVLLVPAVTLIGGWLNDTTASGRVLDESTGDPIAHVLVTYGIRSVFTASDGVYVLEHLPRGAKFSIQTRGYDPVSADTATAEVKLHPFAMTLQVNEKDSGDPPKGETKFVRPEGGFGHAQELTRFIKERYPFCVAGAAYPETHIEAADAESDLRHLKEKVDGGAEFLITQLFFEPDDYFRFVERARKVGIEVPIIPGLMPVTNVAQIHRFTSMCGARVPESLRDLLDRVKDDDQAVIAVGVEWSSDQGRRLLAGGAPGLHFYTLNRSHSSQMVVQNLTAPH